MLVITIIIWNVKFAFNQRQPPLNSLDGDKFTGTKPELNYTGN